MSLPALLLPPPRMRRRRLRMQLRITGTALPILQRCRAQTANPQTTDCTPPPSSCPCGALALVCARARAVHASSSCNLVHMYEDDLGWTLDYDASIMAGGGDFTKAFHAAQTGQRYNR